MSETISPTNIPAGWQRAMLGLFLLAQLSHGPKHGYALAKSLQERGLAPIKGAALYPALGKLEASGHVSTIWVEGQGGPGRKVYELTPAGSAELKHLRAAFRGLSGIIDGF